MVLTYSERAQLHADCSICTLLAALRETHLTRLERNLCKCTLLHTQAVRLPKAAIQFMIHVVVRGIISKRPILFPVVLFGLHSPSPVSLRGHWTDGWSKLDFAKEILVRAMGSSATSTNSKSVSCMGR
jgi:hypothetical protein